MTRRPRRWLELSVRSPAAGEGEVLLADGLVALGGRAVEERDGWFVTHLAEPADLDAFLLRAREVAASFSGRSDVEIAICWIDHEDWAETWKRGLAPRRITPRLVVTPSWKPVDEAPGEIVITLDPGMAFGTAEHGTTRGCLRLLDGVVADGDRIVDVGSGSGILSIAAARLGAREVLALEGDDLAIEALAANALVNGVTDRVTWQARWAHAELLAALAPRDGIVANIESATLRPLLAGFAAALPTGSWLILSGILAEEWVAMRAATEGVGFEFTSVDEDGEWRSGLFTRQ